jgi:hypothetical protein
MANSDYIPPASLAQNAPASQFNKGGYPFNPATGNLTPATKSSQSPQSPTLFT